MSYDECVMKLRKNLLRSFMKEFDEETIRISKLDNFCPADMESLMEKLTDKYAGLM